MTDGDLILHLFDSFIFSFINPAIINSIIWSVILSLDVFIGAKNLLPHIILMPNILRQKTPQDDKLKTLNAILFVASLILCTWEITKVSIQSSRNLKDMAFCHVLTCD